MPLTRKLWLTVAAVALFAAVASTWKPPARTAAAAPADPATMSFQQLCDAYRADRNAALYAALVKRPELPQADFQHVISGQVYVGMTRTGLTCALGMPQQTRSTTSSYGTTDWYSYASPHLLVRLDDGRVHSFSD